jgi:CSLREA domain-containing protein
MDLILNGCYQAAYDDRILGEYKSSFRIHHYFHRRTPMRLALLKTGLLTLALAVITLGLDYPAYAATLTVTTGVDEYDGGCDSHCSLRDAIAMATSGDTITFAGDMTIYLDSELSIAKNLTIDGGVHAVTVSGDSGNDGSRNVRAFNISTGRVVTLKNLTITNSYHSDRGAGIYNAGSLTVSGCHIFNNAASGFGGAIYSYQGLLTVQDSILSNNASAYGGAISTFRGNTVVQNSTFSGNSAPNGGGAIYAYQNSNDTFSMTVLQSTLVNNSSWYGGGIESRNMALVVQDSEFVSNTARYFGGGIDFDSTDAYYKILWRIKAAPFMKAIPGGAAAFTTSTVTCRSVTAPFLVTRRRRTRAAPS